MKHILIGLLAGTALMACSPSSDPAMTPAETPSTMDQSATTPAPPMPADPATADACGADRYADLVGKPITDPGVPGESADVRYIRPGTQVTMDFRADRLNIDIDANEMITGFRCT